MTPITDIHGRQFKTLRVSLTNTCNLGCVYCVEESTEKKAIPSPQLPESNPLSVYKLIDCIATLHSVIGLETIRLTGGEPTLYRELLPLMQGIQQTGIPSVKMTTNGYLLSNKIVDLYNHGLTSLNISLDAIEPEPFFQISRRRNLHKILDGIEKALTFGIEVKINCVVMRGINDSQILPLLAFCHQRNIRIRFLELMQMGHLYGNFATYFFPEEEILDRIGTYANFQPMYRDASATAKYWQLPDGYQFGIIANESDPFCTDCNRLRLDSQGNIFGCLSDNTPIPVTDSLDNPQLLHEKLQTALAQKKTRFLGSTLSMLSIGG